MKATKLPPVDLGPWWLRGEYLSRAASQCSPTASTSQLDCSCFIESNEHCVLETSQDGAPVRKCERLIRKLRQCPGRSPEVLETLQETRTESDGNAATRDAFDRSTPLEGSVSGEALNRNVGEAFEEFVRYTEGLKYQGTKGMQETLQLDPPAPPCNSQPDQSPTMASPPAADSFLSRLFGRRKLQNPEPPAKKWEKFGDIEVI